MEKQAGGAFDLWTNDVDWSAEGRTRCFSSYEELEHSAEETRGIHFEHDGIPDAQPGDTGGAIKLFLKNVHTYPGSSNVYDSLGEAYAAAGKKELAIENYEKSLKMDPKKECGRMAEETKRAKMRG